MRGQASPIIIYLPSGPVLQHSCPLDDGEAVSALAAASNATVVRLNYRVGAGSHYPTPIHDVLSGYDWVRQNLASISTASPSASPVRIGACGQLVGGSLAAMLALTESRMGESGIAAAAINSPVLDWIFPESTSTSLDLENVFGVDAESGDLVEVDAHLKSKSSRAKLKTPSSWDLHQDNTALPASSLLRARSELFRRPANYFDPFASPILFFRSPGADVPPPVSDCSDVGSVEPTTPATRRRAHRAFPPTGSSLRLPDMRISIGEENPLYDQSEELVRLLRRSIMRTHQARSRRQPYDRYEEDAPDDERLAALALADAERRIEFHVPARTGLWGSPREPAWRADMTEAGAWLRKVLT